MSQVKRETGRTLSGLHAGALVVGTVIGAGIFIKPATIAQQAGSPAGVVLAWVLGGLLSTMGALTYAELAVRFPSAGGEYNYLRAAYGDKVAFAYGWTRSLFGSSGSIATVSAGLAEYVAGLVPTLGGSWSRHSFVVLGETVRWQFGARQLVAIGAILLVTIANCGRALVGARMQTLLTALKLAAILVFLGGVFFFAPGEPASSSQASAGVIGADNFSAAVFSTLLAYAGWHYMPMMAGEIKSPKRTLPIALISGMGIVVVLYVALNLAYLHALPIEQVASSFSAAHRDAPSVGQRVAQTFLGGTGVKVMLAVFILSTTGSLNGMISSVARVPYAMAKDGLFFPAFGELSRTGTPVRAILAQGAWACVLVLLGGYDQLSELLLMQAWLSFALGGAALIVLRRRSSEFEGFKVPGYPFVPALFAIASVYLTVNTAVRRPLEVGVALTLAALGAPLYVRFFRKPRGSTTQVTHLDRA